MISERERERGREGHEWKHIKEMVRKKDRSRNQERPETVTRFLTLKAVIFHIFIISSSGLVVEGGTISYSNRNLGPSSIDQCGQTKSCHVSNTVPGCPHSQKIVLSSPFCFVFLSTSLIWTFLLYVTNSLEKYWAQIDTTLSYYYYYLRSEMLLGNLTNMEIRSWDGLLYH